MSKNLSIRIYTASHEIFGDRIAKIRFYPDGTATGGRISLSLNSKTLDIDINWITGGVEVRVPGKE
jgi:general secretion pathway protein H